MGVSQILGNTNWFHYSICVLTNTVQWGYYFPLSRQLTSIMHFKIVLPLLTTPHWWIKLNKRKRVGWFLPLTFLLFKFLIALDDFYLHSMLWINLVFQWVFIIMVHQILQYSTYFLVSFRIARKCVLIIFFFIRCWHHLLSYNKTPYLLNDFF